MRMIKGNYLFGVLGVALILGLTADRGVSQDPNLKSNYGEKEVKAGFNPDPIVVDVEAGGPVQQNKGGVTAWVDKSPDFRLVYTAGNFPLTFYAESGEDTTLLVNLPDGTWLANDDGPGTGLNPLIKFDRPQSGRYEVWVGTLKAKILPKAKLYITELK